MHRDGGWSAALGRKGGREAGAIDGPGERNDVAKIGQKPCGCWGPNTHDVGVSTEVYEKKAFNHL